MSMRTHRYALPFAGLLLASACGRETGGIELVTQALTAQTAPVVGTIKPFAGTNSTCVAVVNNQLQTAPCGGSGQQFFFDGSTIQTPSQTPSKNCLDIQNGNLAAGIVGVVSCNGTINQQWSIVGSQIKSANQTDGQVHCLDVHNGVQSPGTTVGLATCNGTLAQQFWGSGYPAFSGQINPFAGVDGTCVAVVGNGLQIATCGAGSQTFVVNGSAIQTTSNPPQCLDILNGSLAGGVADLTACNATVNQQWTLLGGQIMSANNSDGQTHCLDVHNGVHTIGTQLGVAPCNGTPAQSFFTPGYALPAAVVMPFGGQQGTCVTTSANGLVVGACGTAAGLVFTGAALRTTSNPPRCLEVKGGNLAAGVADFTACTDGPVNINQQWSLAGGQIVSANRTDGQTHCLDVTNGSTALGATLGVAVCNGTAAQEYWYAGYNMKIASTFSPLLGYSTHPECLDVLNDNENAGASIDDSECNGTNAQWFTMDSAHHVRLTSNPALCLGLTSSPSNGLASVGLTACNTGGDLTQSWFFTNRGRDAHGALLSMANMSSGCLDVQNANVSLGTPVDSFTCNGTSAQLWQPTISNGPQLVRQDDGPVLDRPAIYQIFYGDWWNTPFGRSRMAQIKSNVSAVAAFISGMGAPTNQTPFLRQYGVVSATVPTTPVTGVSDGLSRMANVSITGGSVTANDSETSFVQLPNFVFTTALVGGTITISGATQAPNNAGFVVKSVVNSHQALIAPATFNLPKFQNPGALAVNETFGAGVVATISQPGLLTDLDIRNIISSAQTAGQVPQWFDNHVSVEKLVVVYLSLDFSTNRCVYGVDANALPPPPNANCDDSVAGAYHSNVDATANTPYAVVFERLAEPAVRFGLGLAHEIFEACTDPGVGTVNVTAWHIPNGAEICDARGCAGTGQSFSANGMLMESCADDTLGGSCTNTGFIPR